MSDHIVMSKASDIWNATPPKTMTFVLKRKESDTMNEHIQLELPFTTCSEVVEGDTNRGYHARDIVRGEYGELSKIAEELDEALDAEEQGCQLMVLVELADIIGAIEGYVEKHSYLTLKDLIIMAGITRRAFENGHR